MTNNQESESNSITREQDRLRAVASCLLDYLKVHGKSGQVFGVLQFLAQETLRCLDAGKEARFNNFAIRSAVTSETGGDASAWLSRHWKMINGEIRQQREEGLQAFAAQQGLDCYPWVGKIESPGGAGNQALYFLVALPLQANQDSGAHLSEALQPDITYIPAENLKLSWWAGWLFDENRVASSWRKGLLIWPNLIWFIVIVLLGILLLFALSQSTTPLTTHDLTASILLVVIPWYAFRVIKHFERLIDDRIVVASDHLVGFREFGVCLELFKPEGAGTDISRSLRMIKYAASCPICGAQVLLGVGEPDFPRRIVGRCQESPREHVFSFDRVTRSGSRLR